MLQEQRVLSNWIFVCVFRAVTRKNNFFDVYQVRSVDLLKRLFRPCLAPFPAFSRLLQSTQNRTKRTRVPAWIWFTNEFFWSGRLAILRTIYTWGITISTPWGARNVHKSVLFICTFIVTYWAGVFFERLLIRLNTYAPGSILYNIYTQEMIISAP